MSPRDPTPPARPTEWFAQPDGPEQGKGLRFGCTMCGNCCSGPEGYVLLSPAEITALAGRLKISETEFRRAYMQTTSEGPSLKEVPAPAPAKGLDCIFLDRAKFPGKAVCGVYEDRPTQCRTWPFWPSVVKTRQTWERAKRTCPGIDSGRLVPVQQVRIQRDAFEI
ncbi:MAG: YkgJ family cysteine cluster protein [Phycisphaeraceae bacterium]|nr:YkgJ family cysteine cluster protein [Phycisphaeraceae bacterium]